MSEIVTNVVFGTKSIFLCVYSINQLINQSLYLSPKVMQHYTQNPHKPHDPIEHKYKM